VLDVLLDEADWTTVLVEDSLVAVDVLSEDRLCDDLELWLSVERDWLEAVEEEEAEITTVEELLVLLDDSSIS
jgi:hypothetical protein